MGFLKWSKAVSSFTLVAIALLFIGRACSLKEQQDFKPELKEGEREKVVIDTATKRVLRVRRKLAAGLSRNGTGQEANVTSTTDGVRRAVITIDDTGAVSVVTQTKGWIFEPGIGAYTGESIRFGADAQILYYRRAGLHCGLTTDRSWHVRGLIAGSYNFYSNTALVVGLDNKKEFNVGVRIAL